MLLKITQIYSFAPPCATSGSEVKKLTAAPACDIRALRLLFDSGILAANLIATRPLHEGRDFCFDTFCHKSTSFSNFILAHQKQIILINKFR